MHTRLVTVMGVPIGIHELVLSAAERAQLQRAQALLERARRYAEAAGMDADDIGGQPLGYADAALSDLLEAPHAADWIMA